jgi:hypothetical protein
VPQVVMAGVQPCSTVQGHGRIKGQLKVAVAVWMEGLVPPELASAMMVALPFPYAVTIPADAPVFPPELVSTGKILGKEEIQVTESVRSLTYGGVENVPIAKNCPDPCKFSTVSELGIIVSEIIGCGGGEFVTVTEAVPYTTFAGVEPFAGFVHSAVMVAEPVFTPLAKPGESFVHTKTAGVALL